jgi:hypothetical protein
MKNGLFIMLMTLAAGSAAFGQDTLRLTGASWKVYNIQGKAGMKMPIDSLQNYRSVILDEDTMKYFLVDAQRWQKGKYGVWMGAFTASLGDDNNSRRKILISTYGGFLFDDRTKNYYEIAEEKRKEWYDFLNATIEKFDQE